MLSTVRFGTFFAVIVAMLTFTAATRADDAPELTGKWRIVCDGRASSDGQIEFRVTPYQGEPSTVSVQIANGRSENQVARDIRDAFIAQLDKARYHIETDDGEDVLVKRKGDQPKFLLELLSSGVQSLSIKVKHD